MQFFDDFDEENKTDGDTEMTLLERGAVLAFSALIIRAAKKARKAKTYGDLYKLMGHIEDRMEAMEGGMEKLEDEDIPDEEKESMVKEKIIEIQELADQL